MFDDNHTNIYILLARLLKLSGHTPRQVAEMLHTEKGKEFVDFWNEICEERKKIKEEKKKWGFEEKEIIL